MLAKSFFSKFSQGFQLRLFIISLVIFSALIGLMIFTANRLGENNNNAALPRQDELNDIQRNLKLAYETHVTPITRAFAEGQNSGTAEERLALIRKTRDDLLALRVPKEYTDLHLKIVIALSQLEVGYEGDADKLAAGQKSIYDIYESNPWLK